MSIPTVSPWELAGRSRKAARLAAYLAGAFGKDALRATALATPAQWEAIAVMAGTLPPSAETCVEVREILEGYERARALEATKQAVGLGR